MKYHIAVSVIFLLVLAGCATPPSPRESGTVTGAAVGAATGTILGGIAGAPGKGAAIGAAVGAVTGALTGDAIQSEQADRAYASRYAYAPQPYPPPSGTLQIEVTPEDAEIFVDGRGGSGWPKSSAAPAWCRLLRVSTSWNFTGGGSA